jgi:hypothetical protein
MYSMPKIVEKSNTESNTEIDSLKIRIPTDKIQITDSKLIGTKITILEETAEVLREFKDNALKFSNNGISTRFAIETMPIDSRGTTVEFLTMLVNSKLLKSRYLEGITKENIREVYNEIQNYNVVKFSFDDFMQGACTDIDFKTDTRLTIPLFTDELIKFFKVKAKQTQQKDKGYRAFNDQNNKGIQFSDRATTKFKTIPFWKLYYKELELKSKSLEFKEKYLKGQDITNLIRFEYTIKNNKHLKALNLTSNTLEYILNITDQKKKEMLSNTINTHLESSNVMPIKKNGISPTDSILINLITMQMQGGNSYEMIRNFALSSINEKVSKSRKKAQLDVLYLEHIKGSKKDISTQRISDVFSLIGLKNSF